MDRRCHGCVQHSFAYFDSKGRLVKVRISDLSEENRPTPDKFTSSTSEMNTVSLAGFSSDPSVVKTQAHVMKTEKNYFEHPVFHSSFDTPTTASTKSDTATQEGTKSDPGGREFGQGEFTPCLLPSSSSTGEMLASHDSSGTAKAASENKALSVFLDNAPLPRLHGMLVTKGNWLVLMGGIFEFGNQEVTLDDCWTLNVNKRYMASSWMQFMNFILQWE